jgi:hypothetical protein
MALYQNCAGDLNIFWNKMHHLPLRNIMLFMVMMIMFNCLQMASESSKAANAGNAS